MEHLSLWCIHTQHAQPIDKSLAIRPYNTDLQTETLFFLFWYRSESRNHTLASRIFSCQANDAYAEWTAVQKISNGLHRSATTRAGENVLRTEIPGLDQSGKGGADFGPERSSSQDVVPKQTDEVEEKTNRQQSRKAGQFVVNHKQNDEETRRRRQERPSDEKNERGLHGKGEALNVRSNLLVYSQEKCREISLWQLGLFLHDQRCTRHQIFVLI